MLIFDNWYYILASLLTYPVYTAFAVRHNGFYELDVEKFSDQIKLNRATRAQDIEKYVKKFAKVLEKKAIQHPYQWFNFFDFWSDKK